MEVDWLRRIALGVPKAGEGHEAHHKDLVLAIVPWAPLPSGVEALKRYVGMVKEKAGESWGKIRGWRYLVQDKEPGTMLQPGFIEGLRWLGKKGWVFDVGVDHHRGGDWQLEETLEMVKRAHDGVPEAEKVTFILGRCSASFLTCYVNKCIWTDHLCKPDLTIFMEGDVTDDAHFIAWRNAIGLLSRFGKTYIKLSGCFSEIPKEFLNGDAEKIFEMLQPWLIVVLTAFGPSRIMFGSDWPVCTIGFTDAWEKWRQIVQRMCQLGNSSTRDEIMLWSGTAIKAYGIKELM
jgi:L-rhamnono-1,4-lactonase